MQEYSSIDTPVYKKLVNDSKHHHPLIAQPLIWWTGKISPAFKLDNKN